MDWSEIRDSSHFRSAPPPRRHFLPLFLWISASDDRKKKHKKDLNKRREKKFGTKEEATRRQKIRWRREVGGAKIGQTNWNAFSGKLENDINGTKDSYGFHWKREISIGVVTQPAASRPISTSFPREGGMESSGSSTSSKAGGEASTSGASQRPVATSGRSPKVCGVCGDRAKSYHFGGISCDSCKAFFRRSVQNDAYRNFQCPYERSCDITINSRKCCQFCRFHKCLSIGMEKSWVMTEEERLQMLRQRMERKTRRRTEGRGGAAAAASPRPTTPDDEQLASALGVGRAALLRDVVSKYEASLRAVPYAPELRSSDDSDRPVLEIVSMFTTTIERMTHFAGQLEAFRQIPPHDRATLLRCGMVEACMIRAAYAYDASRDCWPDTSKRIYQDCPCLWSQNLSKLVAPELYSMHARFNAALWRMGLDERAIMLLLLVVLFSPERPGLEQGEQIAGEQESFLLLLEDYLRYRYSDRKLFPEVLLKLPDLRQASDAFTQSHLQMSQGDIVQFQHRFGTILGGADPPPQGHDDNNGRSRRPEQPPSASSSRVQDALQGVPPLLQPPIHSPRPPDLPPPPPSVERRS